jgi:hypothetical protein
MNDRDRVEWLAERAAAMFGSDPAKAGAASRDSARLGDFFRLALKTKAGPGDAFRQAVDSAASMPAIQVRVLR